MIPKCKETKKKIDNLEEDTGWIKLDVGNNFENFSWEPLAYRKVGKVVYIHGGGTINKSISSNIAQLPPNCLPRQDIQVPCVSNSGSYIINVIIKYNGEINFLATNSPNTNIGFAINTSFIPR